MNPNTHADRKITENRAAIPLFPPIFTPNDQDNGIRENNGIRFLY
jgi:hypothetical protein